MTRKHPSSPVAKKFIVQRAAAKMVATLFWDAKGVILRISVLMLSNTAGFLTASEMQFVAKKPGLLRRGIVLQHHNATPYSTNLTQHRLSATVGKFFLILPKVQTSHL
ncbi:histone-lysine N-methyltransferase SETMAR [Elysia marginata]|uniref:Histone-lysine N-methyltransferase SETMAR n=1 Tax=Elysia marginata TaxID=1093978 RepID=A0AAV4IRR7_9GAST|nr:histone-lysine N-methyltransferase SETMAR [Elysia marginata]